MIRCDNNGRKEIPFFTGLFSVAWSMTLVCSCPGFYHRMDEPQIQILPSSNPQCLSSRTLRPSFSLPYILILTSQLCPYLSLCSLCPALSVTLWIFASLLRNGTQGTRALQSILQTARSRRTRCKCHVTTWEDDIWRRGGRRPRNTYCYQRCSDLRAVAMTGREEREREHWWERLKTTGERKKI